MLLPALMEGSSPVRSRPSAAHPLSPMLLGAALALAVSILSPSGQWGPGSTCRSLAAASHLRQVAAEPSHAGHLRARSDLEAHLFSDKHPHRHFHPEHHNHHKRRRRHHNTNHHHQRAKQQHSELPIDEPNGRKSYTLSSYKQQALDLAVNRLHILESLDGQLREFAALAALKSNRSEAPTGEAAHRNFRRHKESSFQIHQEEHPRDDDKEPARQLVCQLKLRFGGNDGRVGPTTEDPGSSMPDCLAEPLLARHVPPYMLNLHRQLLSESRKLADAVQLMPYKSLIMRSFGQPSLPVRSLTAFKRSRRPPEEAQNVSPNLPEGAHSIWTDRAGDHRDDYNGDLIEAEEHKRVKLRDLEPAQLNVVVQLSALQVPEEVMAYQEHYIGGDEGSLNDRQLEGNSSSSSYQFGEQTADSSRDLRAPSLATKEGNLGPANDRRPNEKHLQWTVEEPSELQVAACDLGQRLLAAHNRRDLCYWFQISEQLRAKINGSFETTLAAGQQTASHQDAQFSERLVEAELHLFKLLPELWLPTSDAGQRQSRSDLEAPLTGDVFQPLNGQNNEFLNGNPSKNRSSRTSNNIYQLKTNLLEVSLYQILPKRRTSRARSNSSEDDEFPLRLLDIRRIDLYSSGWETFYVKGAVADWIEDASSNLDLYDHHLNDRERGSSENTKHAHHRVPPSDQQLANAKRQTSELDGLNEKEEVNAQERPVKKIVMEMGVNGQRRQQEARHDGIAKRPATTTTTPFEYPPEAASMGFDLSHQPILVIYTTTTGGGS